VEVEPAPVARGDGIVEVGVEQIVSARGVVAEPVGIGRHDRHAVVGHRVEHIGVVVPGRAGGVLVVVGRIIADVVLAAHLAGVAVELLAEVAVVEDPVLLGGLFGRHQRDHRADEGEPRAQFLERRHLRKLALSARQALAHDRGLDDVELADHVERFALPARRRQHGRVARVAREDLDIDGLVQIEVPHQHEGEDDDHRHQEDDRLPRPAVAFKYSREFHTIAVFAKLSATAISSPPDTARRDWPCAPRG